MSIVRRYLDTVRAETQMTAIYPPNMTLSLGDYGIMEDGRFVPIGNIATLPSAPVKFAPREGARDMSREFKSKGVRKTILGAGAKIPSATPTVKPSVEFSFASEFSAYVSVAGCTFRQIEDLASIGEQLLSLHADGKWDREWKVVTQLFESKNITIILSQEQSTKMVLEATSEISSIDMSDVNLSLRVVYDDSSAEHWITEKPNGRAFTPFCWFHHVKVSWWSGARLFAPNAATDDEKVQRRAEDRVFAPFEPIDSVFEGWRAR
jgi:hypothetical protein